MKEEAVKVEMSASRYALVCLDCACLDASPRLACLLCPQSQGMSTFFSSISSAGTNGTTTLSDCLYQGERTVARRGRGRVQEKNVGTLMKKRRHKRRELN